MLEARFVENAPEALEDIAVLALDQRVGLRPVVGRSVVQSAPALGGILQLSGVVAVEEFGRDRTHEISQSHL